MMGSSGVRLMLQRLKTDTERLGNSFEVDRRRFQIHLYSSRHQHSGAGSRNQVGLYTCRLQSGPSLFVCISICTEMSTGRRPRFRRRHLRLGLREFATGLAQDYASAKSNGHDHAHCRKGVIHCRGMFRSFAFCTHPDSALGRHPGN